MGKWYTCAPCRFVSNEFFFRRDSGLLSKELQKLGHESKVVLLGPAYEGDLPGIIRADFDDMSSAAWWREQKLDGVIMVAWGRHRDTPIVRAIAASGTPLVVHIDGTGIPFPISGILDTLRTFWREERGTNQVLIIRCFQFALSALKRTSATLLRHSFLKFRHLRYADVVTVETPTSLEGHNFLCSFYGGKDHGVNLLLAGVPIPTSFVWDPSIPKEKRIVAIGRWEDLRQKRPFVLMAVCASIARKHPDLCIDIFGTKTDALAKWHERLEPSVSERILVHGLQPVEAVIRAVKKAQISFFPSSHEGVPYAMLECLACGVTTVALDTPYMPGARWAAQSYHADLAAHDTTEDFFAALNRGLEKWAKGEYSAQQISEVWVPRTRPQHVLEIMLTAVATSRSASKRTGGQHKGFIEGNK